MKNEDKTILIVEDDLSSRELLTMALEMEGYKVFPTVNGKEAIEAITQQAIDLVLLDLYMPVMDGVHVMRWLREELKLTLPIIVMTAMTDDATKQSVISSGANDFVTKPLDLSEIITSVDKNIRAL